MIVYVLGNPLAAADSRPSELLPLLKRTFPDLSFAETDPTEEFSPEEGSVIIDSVKGLTECRWFDDLDVFVRSASVSVHDYDVYLHLQLLKKMGKLPGLYLFGIPADGNMSDAEILTAFRQGIPPTLDPEKTM